jgi:hypothetical protein
MRFVATMPRCAMGKEVLNDGLIPGNLPSLTVRANYDSHESLRSRHLSDRGGVAAKGGSDESRGPVPPPTR